jgi:hypothetical protein
MAEAVRHLTALRTLEMGSKCGGRGGKKLERQRKLEVEEIVFDY